MKTSVSIIALTISLFFISCNNQEISKDKLQSCIETLSDCIGDCGCANRCAKESGISNFKDLDSEDPVVLNFAQCLINCKKKGAIAKCRKECHNAFFECVNNNK
ncbi:MAG: hypothetical protein KUG68_09500 [Flavobacteriaceae bacterium]|nr:hypothetical protein [Flavobacteriaceae bacterium]